MLNNNSYKYTYKYFFYDRLVNYEYKYLKKEITIIQIFTFYKVNTLILGM